MALGAVTTLYGAAALPVRAGSRSAPRAAAELAALLWTLHLHDCNSSSYQNKTELSIFDCPLNQTRNCISCLA